MCHSDKCLTRELQARGILRGSNSTRSALAGEPITSGRQIGQQVARKPARVEVVEALIAKRTSGEASRMPIRRAPSLSLAVVATTTTAAVAMLALLLGSDAPAALAQAYQFPIQHQNHQQQQQYLHRQGLIGSQAQQQHFAHRPKPVVPPLVAGRRSDMETISPGGRQPAASDEARQLHQLHQVVDTVAQLLKEEEHRPDSDGGKAVELRSEIRRALEELEAQGALESRSDPEQLFAASTTTAAAAAATSASNNQQQRQQFSTGAPVTATAPATERQKTIESIIEELGDELIADQIASASQQETERLIIRKQDEPALAHQQQMSPQARVVEPTPSSAQPASQQPTQASALFIGRLDSLSSGDLSSKLSDEFYSFHSDAPRPAGAELNEASSSSADSSFAPNHDQQQVAVNSVKPDLSSVSGQDLVSAAQTRDSRIAPQGQANLRPANVGRFEQPDQSTIRFDFSQPVQQQQAADQEALVRAFRQQTGANLADSPFSSAGSGGGESAFWRPPAGGAPSNQRQSDGNNAPAGLINNDTGDIGEQYSRARAASGPHSLPALPAPRFQSISPLSPGQFVPSNQAADSHPQSSTARQQRAPPPQHIHFTGHSLIASSNPPPFAAPREQQPASSFNGNTNNRNALPSPFASSTLTPLISVLSGGDTSRGNSVSWTPPAGQSQPPQLPSPQQQQSLQLFNQQFSVPHLASAARPATQGLPSDNEGQRRGPQHQREREQPQHFQKQFRPPQSNDGQRFFAPLSTTEANNAAAIETSTEDRFLQPTTTQWSPLDVSQPSTAFSAGRQEADGRDELESQNESPIRPTPNQQQQQRFFSPNDLLGSARLPSSTLAPIEPLASRAPSPSSSAAAGGFNSHNSRHHHSQQQAPSGFTATTTTSTTTTTTTTPASVVPSESTANSTAANNKKEDTVIYYYYYYDDNKNATVVAKNISSATASSPSATPGTSSISTSATLDPAALEADGGLEDTPYIDDPAPAMNPRLPVAGVKPPRLAAPTATTSSTTTTTTVPTTTASTLTTTNSNFEHESRSRLVSPSSSRFDSRQSFSEPTLHMSAPPATTANSASRGSFSSSSSLAQAPFSRQQEHRSFTPSPFNVPSTSASTSTHPPSSLSSSAPTRSLSPSASHPAGGHHGDVSGSTGGRLVSGEPAFTRNQASSGGSLAPTRQNGNKLQSDLIQNVLNGIPASGGQRGGQSQASQTVAAAAAVTAPSREQSAANSRVQPLSNASRYGTNNNLMLDPYGLDPAAPATLTHTADSSAPISHNHNHKSWQQHQHPQVAGATNQAPSAGSAAAATAAAAAHQFNRKPAAVAASGEQLPPAPTASNTRSANHQFSSQRNPSSSVAQHQQRGSSSSSSAPAQTGSDRLPAELPPVAARPASQTSQRAAAPELQGSTQPRAALPTQQSPTTTTTTATTITTTANLGRQPADSAESFASSRLASNVGDSGASQRAESHAQQQQAAINNNNSAHGNGRPSSSEGNTSNAFTRSPLSTSSTAATTPTPAPPARQWASQSSSGSSSSSSSSGDQRAASLVSGTLMTTTTTSSTKPSASIGGTSMSRSFVTPQQVQVTTSVSPPIVTSTVSVMTTVSQSSSSFSSPSLPTTNTTPASVSQSQSPASSQNGAASSTVSPSSPTTPASGGQPGGSAEAGAADSANVASARRKFGSRNNRFQTRINSLSAARSASGSTSTSSTAAPSTSTTTRRPASSTTRKSSKQLFTGRRRLNNPTSAPDSSASGSGSPSAAAVSTTQSIPSPGAQASVVSESSDAAGALSGAASRSGRFGSSFAARSRFTTTAPSAAAQEQSSTSNSHTQKPNLFAGQRASPKPRLPFLKANNKPSSATNETGTNAATSQPAETTASSNGTSSSLVAATITEQSEPMSMVSGEKSGPTSPEKLGLSSGELISAAIDSAELTSTGLIEDNSIEKKEPEAATETAASSSGAAMSSNGVGSSSESQPSGMQQPSSTSAPPTSAAGESATASGRNKPKVRPLFASRQRNSSLFGNRRSNTTAAAA